jgi:hypothetical protein
MCYAFGKGVFFRHVAVCHWVLRNFFCFKLLGIETNQGFLTFVLVSLNSYDIIKIYIFG